MPTTHCVKITRNLYSSVTLFGVHEVYLLRSGDSVVIRVDIKTLKNQRLPLVSEVIPHVKLDYFSQGLHL